MGTTKRAAAFVYGGFRADDLHRVACSAKGRRPMTDVRHGSQTARPVREACDEDALSQACGMASLAEADAVPGELGGRRRGQPVAAAIGWEGRAAGGGGTGEGSVAEGWRGCSLGACRREMGGCGQVVCRPQSASARR